MRRGSIARLMTAIGLSSLGLLFFRGWLGRENWFGFLGLLGWLVMVAWIGWLVTGGGFRRFFAGFGMTGLVLWVAVLIWPESILDFCRDWIIIPAEHRLLHKPDDFLRVSRLDVLFLSAYELMDSSFVPDPSQKSWQIHCTWFHDRANLYGGYPELQGWFLIPMAVVATFGGMIGSRFRSVRSIFPSPTQSP